MQRISRLSLFLAVLLGTAWLVGCAEEPAPKKSMPASGTTPATTDDKTSDTTTPDAATTNSQSDTDATKTEPTAAGDTTGATDSASSEEDKIAAELAKLSEEDRKLAVAQKVCPVSDSRLGSMPGIKKVEVEGRVVFLCCESCEPALKAEPAKFLAKLDAASSATPEPNQN
jgi:hypothetical protein